MAPPTLRLLNAIMQNTPIMATFMALKGARTAQVVAHTGLDAIIIDCEHGNIGDSDMHDMVSAVASTGTCSPIVRVRGPTGPLIKRALDTGAHGLLVPQVDTAAQAESIVTMSKFPPRGVRGAGSAFACFEHGLAGPAEYVAKANMNVVIMVQIESRRGVEEVEAICAVDGIDLVFIGPFDLALSLLGYTPAKGTEPEFVGAIEKIRAAARRYGKKVGIIVPTGEAAKKEKERFDFVAIGTDVQALQRFYAKELEDARS